MQTLRVGVGEPLEAQLLEQRLAPDRVAEDRLAVVLLELGDVLPQRVLVFLQSRRGVARRLTELARVDGLGTDSDYALSLAGDHQ